MYNKSYTYNNERNMQPTSISLSVDAKSDHAPLCNNYK